jgi:hypothetical protein
MTVKVYWYKDQQHENVFHVALDDGKKNWQEMSKDEWLSFYHLGKRINITFSNLNFQQEE